MEKISKTLPGGTHIPVLLACLQKTSGPVLEFGVGCWSTSLMTLFAAGDRYVRSVESDKRWFELFCQMHKAVDHARKSWGGTHDVIHVPNYDDAVVDDHRWDIVFLDHNPPERRGVDAARLRDNCRLMIAHDSQHPAYEIKPVFKTFKYRLTDFRQKPCTTVASDEPLDWLKDEIPEILYEDNYDE